MTERDGESKTIQSCDLVPGDILHLHKNMTVPCDCILLSGEILLDENTLTGEVTPISKLEIETSPLKFNYNHFQMNFIFEGTKVLNTVAAQTQNQYVRAIAVRTGFMSFRGQLIRAFIFPVRQNIQFYKECAKYLIVLMLLNLLVFLIFLKF